MHRLPALAAVASLMLLACGRPGSSGVTPVRQDSAAAAEIRQTLAGWVEAYRREDNRAMAQVWAPDVVGWYPGQPPWTYADALEGAAQPPCHDPARPSVRLSIEEVMVRGDLAVVRDVWHFTRRFGTDSTLTRRLWGYEVWRRQPDGRWRIARWLSGPEAWQRTE